VTQFVRREPVQADTDGRRVDRAPPPVVVPQHPGRAGEHQLVSPTTGAGGGERLVEEPRHRDLPALVRPGIAEHQVPVHVGHRPGHGQSTSQQIDVAHPERGQLA
jgi:hypothetical protein